MTTAARKQRVSANTCGGFDIIHYSYPSYLSSLLISPVDPMDEDVVEESEDEDEDNENEEDS